VILLITGSSRAAECVAAIERKTHRKTLLACSLAKALQILQQQEIDVLVTDESFQQMDAAGEALICDHSGPAMPVYVNLALHSSERVAAEVSCGLQRLTLERSAAMGAVARELRNQLRGEVTAILLNSELAMRQSSLTPGTMEKLKLVHATAETMRQKLDEIRPKGEKLSPRPKLVSKAAIVAAAR
jgi:hypothetical protein